ncbi:hypothetical protein PG994_009041 [Apiospora phragmitis]|uniref:Uncharacterized protein n=1 Tax=Apiospora phragmitis TaxID=2905665 RepID=A0ABR1UL06_9PEZI
MAIQADLGPPVLPPLPLQPPFKPPSFASRTHHSTDLNNNNRNNISSLSQSQRHQQQQQQIPEQNHRNNHHRQHVYQQRRPVVYSPYPSIVSYGHQRPTAATTRQDNFPSIPTPSTPPGTGGYTTLVNTSPRKDAPLPRTPVSTTPTKTSRCPNPQSPRTVVTPTTPPTAAAQQSETPRPPPPAHRRIRYHQHHTSHASARSELTSLSSGPLNNSLLQMTAQTPVLTWPQKCVLAMSKARYLASEPSIASQVFRSYYEDRDDADKWMGEEEEEAAAVNGLPSPPPEQDDYHFDFHYHHNENTAGTSTSADYDQQQQHQYREIGVGNADAGEVSSLSKEREDHRPTPAAATKETDHPRPPPTSALVSHLTVGAAVFRIDVRSQRPTILLLKKRSAAAAAAATTIGPASGLPSPYQQHHPQHSYNPPFLDQLLRHLPPAERNNNQNDENENDNDDKTTTRSTARPPLAVWELPSGRVDDGDYCISDAIARCVKRQTALNVVRISSMLRESTTAAAGNEAHRLDRQNVDYDPLRALPRGAAFASAGGGSAPGNTGASVRFMDEEGWPDLTLAPKEKLQLQLNWTVLVANAEDVVLQGVEHEEFVWANWNVLDMLNLTSATREVAKEALEWAGRCSF